MKAAQEAAKAAKAPVKGRKKNNIFHSNLKASVVVLFLFYLSRKFSGLFQILNY
jgi:hypothetical protein